MHSNGHPYIPKPHSIDDNDERVLDAEQSLINFLEKSSRWMTMFELFVIYAWEWVTEDKDFSGIDLRKILENAVQKGKIEVKVQNFIHDQTGEPDNIELYRAKSEDSNANDNSS